MPETMVEKVARGMWQDELVRCYGDKLKNYPWENETEPTRDLWRIRARAAIEAMREPTAEMVDAGGYALLNQIEGSEAVEASVCFRAMLTAAMEEGRDG